MEEKPSSEAITSYSKMNKVHDPGGQRTAFASLPPEYSHLYLGIEGELAAVICIEDPLRPEAPEVIPRNCMKQDLHRSS